LVPVKLEARDVFALLSQSRREEIDWAGLRAAAVAIEIRLQPDKPPRTCHPMNKSDLPASDEALLQREVVVKHEQDKADASQRRRMLCPQMSAKGLMSSRTCSPHGKARRSFI
jgi:hypothetical protein